MWYWVIRLIPLIRQSPLYFHQPTLLVSIEGMKILSIVFNPILIYNLIPLFNSSTFSLHLIIPIRF